MAQITANGEVIDSRPLENVLDRINKLCEHFQTSGAGYAVLEQARQGRLNLDREKVEEFIDEIGMVIEETDLLIQSTKESVLVELLTLMGYEGVEIQS